MFRFSSSSHIYTKPPTTHTHTHKKYVTSFVSITVQSGHKDHDSIQGNKCLFIWCHPNMFLKRIRAHCAVFGMLEINRFFHRVYTANISNKTLIYIYTTSARRTTTTTNKYQQKQEHEQERKSSEGRDIMWYSLEILLVLFYFTSK